MQKKAKRLNEDDNKKVFIGVNYPPPRLDVEKLKIILYEFAGKRTVDKHIDMWGSILNSMFVDEWPKNSIATLEHNKKKYAVVIDDVGELSLAKIPEDYKARFIDFFKDKLSEELSLTDTEFEELLERMDGKIFKNEDEPDFIPEGFKYLDGSILTGDYRIVDSHGNVFLWVQERTIQGKVIKGHYWSLYPVSTDYRVDGLSSNYLLRIDYDKVMGVIQKVFPGSSRDCISMGSVLEYFSFCDQLDFIKENNIPINKVTDSLEYFYTRVSDMEKGEKWDAILDGPGYDIYYVAGGCKNIRQIVKNAEYCSYFRDDSIYSLTSIRIVIRN